MTSSIFDDFFWKVYTRMYGEFGEFFPEFFYLKININWIFLGEFSGVVSGQVYISLLDVFMFCFTMFGWIFKSKGMT